MAGALPEHIEFRTTVEGIDETMLSGFFQGWPAPPSQQVHLEILKRATYVVLAFDTQALKVCGFVTCISDGILSAYIPLLEVLPDYRGVGIGRTLVRTLLDQMPQVYMVDLCCDPEKKSFYTHLGFSESFGMSIRRYSLQSGALDE